MCFLKYKIHPLGMKENIEIGLLPIRESFSVSFKKLYYCIESKNMPTISEYGFHMKIFCFWYL